MLDWMRLDIIYLYCDYRIFFMVGWANPREIWRIYRRKSLFWIGVWASIIIVGIIVAKGIFDYRHYDHINCHQHVSHKEEKKLFSSP